MKMARIGILAAAFSTCGFGAAQAGGKQEVLETCITREVTAFENQKISYMFGTNHGWLRVAPDGLQMSDSASYMTPAQLSPYWAPMESLRAAARQHAAVTIYMHENKHIYRMDVRWNFNGCQRK